MDPIPLLSTFAVVALAELGDKTQLLTIAFATRYRARDVLASVLVASAVLMVLAVIAGRVLFELIPTTHVQVVAGMLFILFALWILFFDEEDGDEESQNNGKNPFMAVFGAFILAETGDKTQLAAVALAVKYSALFEVWLGATLGMFAANGIGVIAGNRIRKKLPETLIKRIAAALFLLFGAVTLYSAL